MRIFEFAIFSSALSGAGRSPIAFSDSLLLLDVLVVHLQDDFPNVGSVHKKRSVLLSMCKVKYSSLMGKRHLYITRAFSVF